MMKEYMKMIRLYYQEIKKELEAKGVKFETNSDTEVLLSNYIEKKNKLSMITGACLLF